MRKLFALMCAAAVTAASVIPAYAMPSFVSLQPNERDAKIKVTSMDPEREGEDLDDLILVTVDELMVKKAADAAFGDIVGIAEEDGMKREEATEQFTKAMESVLGFVREFVNPESKSAWEDLVGLLGMDTPEKRQVTIKETDEQGNEVVKEMGDLAKDYTPLAYSSILVHEGAREMPDIIGELTMEYPANDLLKGKNAEDLLIMLIHPVTGECLYFQIDPELFNAETGEFKIDLPFCGVITVLQKLQPETANQ